MKNYLKTPVFSMTDAFGMKAFFQFNPCLFKFSPGGKCILSLVVLFGMAMSTLNAAEDETPLSNLDAVCSEREADAVHSSLITTYNCAPVAVDIVNPDFEILYKAGSTTVFSPPLTNGQHVSGTDHFSMTGPTVTFSDNTTGNQFHMAGWTFNTYMGVNNFNSNFFDPRDMMVWMNGASFGGGTDEKTMSQTLDENVEQNTTYHLTADFGWRNDNGVPSPPVLRLYAGGTLLTPDASVDPALVKGGFVTYSRTYYITDPGISGLLRIEFGMAANTNGQQLNTDRIRLTKTPDDCTCDPGYYAVTEVINGETLITGCQPCPPGFYCPDGVEALPCPAGRFSAETAATFCQDCPAGTYSDVIGSAECTNCDAGFSSGVGAASCFPDTDSDDIADGNDNCIETSNPDQADSDGDGIGDVCDACPGIPDPNCATCGNDKYLVCHIPAGNPENAQQLCLPLNGANAHIGNHGGCYLGLCNSGFSAATDQRGDQFQEVHEHIHTGVKNDNPFIETSGGDAYYFEIMPNPASGSVSVHLHGHEAGAHLNIRDQLGRLVWSQPLDAAESMFNISLEGNRFVNGIYYVNILNKGEQVTRRLAVQK